MTIKEANSAAYNFRGDIRALVNRAKLLNDAQRRFIVELYEALGRANAEFETLSAYDVRVYHDGRKHLMPLVNDLFRKVDTAWERTFGEDEGVLAYCDGEEPHACSEARRRLVAITYLNTI